MKTYYTFDDVFLIPKFSNCESRQSLSTDATIGSLHLKTPIMSSNMDTVTGPIMAVSMYESGGCGALHRFLSVDKAVRDYEYVLGQRADCFVSIGVNDHELYRAQALYNHGARHFIVDIAHGHSSLMHHTLNILRNTFGDNVYIVAGNVATPEAVKDLASWGADCIKVGVGGGSCCSTRVVTGHGVPMFTCLLECCAQADLCNVKIIADGGIRSSGDMIKSLVAGADMVMIGSLLAGTDEAPGDVIMTPSGAVKEFRGMASRPAMEARFGNTKTNLPVDEGVKTVVPLTGSARRIVSNLTKGIKSGMSYCNATSLDELSLHAEWALQSMAGSLEGRPHILTGGR